MKRLMGMLLIFCLIPVFVGCSQRADNQAEMLQMMGQEAGIEHTLLQPIGSIEQDDRLFLCAMTGNEQQGYQYYGAEFKEKGNQYEFVHSHTWRQRGLDLFSLEWADGYLFLSNHEQSRSLRIHFPDGEQEDEEIAITTQPFLYFLDLSRLHQKASAYSFEYHFLDEKGEAISQ